MEAWTARTPKPAPLTVDDGPGVAREAITGQGDACADVRLPA